MTRLAFQEGRGRHITSSMTILAHMGDLLLAVRFLGGVLVASRSIWTGYQVWTLGVCAQARLHDHTHSSMRTLRDEMPLVRGP